MEILHLLMILVAMFGIATALLFYLLGSYIARREAKQLIYAAEQAAMRERLRADRAVDRLASHAGVPPVSEVGIAESEGQALEAKEQAEAFREVWAEEA